jgi:hypothetical protein
MVTKRFPGAKEALMGKRPEETSVTILAKTSRTVPTPSTTSVASIVMTISVNSVKVRTKQNRFSCLTSCANFFLSGDCDGDSQCEGKLKCFQRNGDEKVPGCKGSTDGKTTGKDFCYDPDDEEDDDDDPPDGSDTIQDLGWEYCDTHECKKCQGDCDSDNHCAGSLKCFQRSGIQKVPGCKGSSAESTRESLDVGYDW